MSKIDVVIKIFKHAACQGSRVDYVLMDSWFTRDALICAALSVKKQTIHLTGMFIQIKEEAILQRLN